MSERNKRKAGPSSSSKATEDSKVFRIAELHLRGIENLLDEEIAELILLEEAEILETDISPLMEYYGKFFCKEPETQDRGSGWAMIRKQIYASEISCRKLVRMNTVAFQRLCEILQGRYSLQDTQNMAVDESVAIFLMICGQNDSQGDIGLRFGHAQETICRKFHEVLGAMERMAVDYIRPRTTQELEAISNRLQRDKRYWPYFKTIRFVNRKGSTSLNVLAMCDFDMLFYILLVGMAGSAHDARVLSTAIPDDTMFPTPAEGKYYLVDSGYANKRGYLAPYRKQSNVGTRYHLQEFFYGEPPRNSKEMFNRWHASLRSVIERTFGVWKKKWRVLNEFPRYNIAVQRRVIFATMGLHNFIRKNNIEDDDFEEADKDSDVSYGQQNVNDDVNDDQGIRVEEETHDGNYMKIVRDQIAEQIWSASRRSVRQQR
ncbi:PREDICTED: uncharacterized protein LOC104743739 [Camelina sativa]|uniref:Uncharacterized protein LOC104743739 n=1 Tax=Camelina sativa TaxID=90675 RepID=A0ABM0VYI3_CAMSA|nr:PREDICTED: uncharacterized protein LOC104743739 [Camelina sativa]